MKKLVKVDKLVGVQQCLEAYKVLGMTRGRNRSRGVIETRVDRESLRTATSL